MVRASPSCTAWHIAHSVSLTVQAIVIKQRVSGLFWCRDLLVPGALRGAPEETSITVSHGELRKDQRVREWLQFGRYVRR